MSTGPRLFQFKLADTSAFVGTNPTGELITSGLRVIHQQSTGKASSRVSAGQEQPVEFRQASSRYGQAICPRSWNSLGSVRKTAAVKLPQLRRLRKLNRHPGHLRANRNSLGSRGENGRFTSRLSARDSMPEIYCTAVLESMVESAALVLQPVPPIDWRWNSSAGNGTCQ